MKKRKRDDSADGNNTHNLNAPRRYIHPSTSTTTKFKKSKTPKISGQPLPLPRLIESLDKLKLQKVIEDLITIHPEIQSTLINISPKPTLHDSLTLLKEKFDMIISHLPYKCDVESDYSYLRIKQPHLQEFFSCVSDFILNYLPPLETNMIHSLSFLHEITNLIHDLPNFTNQEFQYTKSTAYEQIANCWLIVLSQTDDDEALKKNDENDLIKIISELNVVEKVHKHDDVSFNKFQKVIDYCNHKLEQHELIMNENNSNGAVPSSLSDLITVDYSKYSIANTSSM
ncbi:STS1 Tethering factor for nuclear proteasome STS1 [Candida maltosa Xu316]